MQPQKMLAQQRGTDISDGPMMKHPEDLGNRPCYLYVYILSFTG